MQLDPSKPQVLQRLTAPNPPEIADPMSPEFRELERQAAEAHRRNSQDPLLNGLDSLRRLRSHDGRMG
jgi:hypothetical protein